MSVSMAASKPGGTVSIFGRKISWDALLVADAGLAGVFFLYRVGTPLGSLGAGTMADTSGGGVDTGLSTVPSFAPLSATSPYAGPATYAAGSPGDSVAGPPQMLGATGYVAAPPSPSPPAPGIASRTFWSAPAPSGFATVAAFAPIAPWLGGLLPGILTAAPSAVAPAAVPSYVAPTPYAKGGPVPI